MTEQLADGNWPGAGRVLPSEKLIRAVNEAQRRDAEDERRLPLTRDERSVVKRRIPSGTRTRKKLPYWACGYIRFSLTRDCGDVSEGMAH
jgi:hypothetical protein